MAEALFQIGIKALIMNEDNKLLLLSSDASDGSTRWDMPGGRMDDDETFLQTLERELTEEIGCTYVGDPEYFATSLSSARIPVGDKQLGLVLVTYRAHIPNNTQIQLNDYETGYAWFDSLEASKLLSNKYPSDFTQRISQL